ncbi:MAG: insulinase family protein [Planctomycetes bacterium]|nr:insulinase family protein [Planctomycetota bacterium]
MTLLSLPEPRFKRARMDLHFDRPLDDGQSPARTLLGRVLEQGTHSLPTQMERVRAEENLYGAETHLGGHRVGAMHRMSLSLGWVGERFLPPDSKVAEGTLQLGEELLLNPLRGEGGALFSSAIFEREQAQLCRRIRHMTDDRSSWAQERFLRLLCEGEEYGTPPWSDEKSIAALTPQDCESARVTLCASALTAIAVGPVDHELLTERLARWNPTEDAPPTGTSKAPGALREIQEAMDMDQARFHLGFRCLPPKRAEELEAQMLAVSLFGGGIHSRLFREVREARSLCYGISAGLRSLKGIVMVSAGIDASSFEAVRDEVLAQAELLARGEFGEEELEVTKTSMMNDLESMSDSSAAIAQFYGREHLLELNRTPAERMVQMTAITREQVATAAAQWIPDLVYLLGPEVN